MQEKISIKAIRVNMGKTQQEFADLIGKSKISYCNKENGKQTFTFDEVVAISEYSGIDMNYIKA